MREQPASDWSHPAMAVNLDACIQCTLCVRACREVQVNDVIGMAYRGHEAMPVFDQDDPMGASTCVACGECVQACPTGALMPSAVVERETGKGSRAADRQVDSVCPYCGVGCQITYNIRDDRIAFVQGRDGPSNENRLCVKGRFGFDYARSPERLTRPMIRKPGMRKGEPVDPANPWTHFREASWEEALRLAATGLVRIRKEHGPQGLAGFGSAKCSNEEAYLFQKLVRTGFGTNNVDHCTRLCHASVGGGPDGGDRHRGGDRTLQRGHERRCRHRHRRQPDRVNHPVAATFFKQAAKRGTKLIVMDPRGQALGRYATHMLQFKPGSDVALLNALMHVIVEEGLYDTAVRPGAYGRASSA